MKTLLNMAGYMNKGELSAIVPIFLQIAKADKLSRLSLFQTVINSFLNNRHTKEFSCMSTLTMFNNLLSMKRNTITVDVVNTG